MGAAVERAVGFCIRSAVDLVLTWLALLPFWAPCLGAACLGRHRRTLVEEAAEVAEGDGYEEEESEAENEGALTPRHRAALARG
eukprot:477054-Alexandrium_andersonii.AAC.1